MFKKLCYSIMLLIFSWVFLIAEPYLGTAAYAGQNLPETDLSEPSPIEKVEFRRIAGNSEAVYLNIPSNQITKRIALPAEPQPLILAKYDPSTSTGTLAVMRIRQVGANIHAQILRISPRNFQHFFGPHLYHFALLHWKGAPGCDYAEKFLRDDDPPNVDTMKEIIERMNPYDLGQTALDPTPIVQYLPAVVMNQAKINRSNSYWHQRFNTDPCWERIGLKQFDDGSGNFVNISHYGFLKLIALAQHIHKAPVGVLAMPEIRQAVETSTKKSVFKKKVTTTVKYYLKPKYTVSTLKLPGMYSDYDINATWDKYGTYSFVNVQGDHNFPVDETLIYEWSQSKSGWTGLFVFLASVVIGAALGGVGMLAGLGKGAVLIGAGVGAIGGLIASGFSPTTNVTAHITPFSNSVYDLDPSRNMSGDAKAVADRTRITWLMPDPQNTPGGVQQFVLKIDYRKALACGGASHTRDCSEPAIEQLPLSDPRARQLYEEMFDNNKELMKYRYNFDRSGSTVPIPVPVQ
jgi:hypothetical protein